MYVKVAMFMVTDRLKLNSIGWVIKFNDQFKLEYLLRLHNLLNHTILHHMVYTDLPAEKKL